MIDLFQKSYAKREKSLKNLTRIVPAALMLAEEKRGVLLQQIRKATALENVRFDNLCLSLVHNFINHCQNLPETSSSYYSQQGGLLDHALNRTEAALNLFQHYLIQEGREELSEEQKLWQYALFSAGVLQGVGKLQIEYRVDLYDNKGQFLKHWNPVEENLVSLGSHYSYEFQKESDEKFRRCLNLLLARFIMPENGFSWIASNRQVLAVWCALLNEDLQAAGTLGAILIRADAIAIQRYFNQLLVKTYGSRGSRYGRANAFTGGVPESVINKEQIGVEFIQWLTESLAAGRIEINKAPLHMVPGGLVMSAEMFRLFARENPEYKNWQAVQNAFLSLGLHALGSEDTASSRNEQNQKIIFDHYSIALPDVVQLNNMHTGKSAPISATELIYWEQNSRNDIAVGAIPHLSAAGIWQTEGTGPQAPLQPGVNSRA